MRRLTLCCSSLLIVAACSGNQEENSGLHHYNVDGSRITASGLSSGGYMAGQLHLAHSDVVSGVAILSGGPYWCAQGSLAKGLGPCVNGGDFAQERLLGYAREMAAATNIASLENLSDDPVWLFHGRNDAVVSKDVVNATAAFYGELTSNDSLVVVTDIAAAHGMPTISIGAQCDTMASPFLNACSYDAAGELLTTLYGPLQDRATAARALITIAQARGDDAEMLDSAFLYVPESCTTGQPCGLHVALHGCQQSSEFVGDAFVTGAGYNEWAESNNLIVLYPQAASSKIAPMNPLGCWDWWGYTDEHYATRNGLQIAVIKSMIDAIAGRKL